MSRPFVLLYITAAFPWPRSEAFLIPELERLAARGARVTVVPTRLVEPPLALPERLVGRVALRPFALLDPASARALAALLVRHPGRMVGLVRTLFGSGPRRGVKNLAVLPKAARLAKLARELEVDHVHAHWAGVSATLALLVATLAERPFSITAHSWDVAENNLLALKGERAAFVRFISERERERGEALGVAPAKSVVLHMGVPAPPPHALATHPGAARFELVCIASLDEVKGHPYLFEALRLLGQRGVDVRLTLFGDGPLRAPLERLAADLGERVRFRGAVAHAALQSELEAGGFHAAVLASIVDRDGEDEGIPVALMEAMRCGLPAVATTSGSIPELLPAALGLTAPERAPEPLADILERLVRDADFFARSARAMRRIVRAEFCADTLTDELLRRMRAAGV